MNDVTSESGSRPGAIVSTGEVGGATGPERLCQEPARFGHCWGILRHCYARVSRPKGAKVKWTKIGIYCERCGHFEPDAAYKPVRPAP